MITGFIKAEDIQDLIKQGAKFINITITELRAPDDKGNTHTIYLTQSKDDRAAKAPKKYIGKAKEITFNNDLPI